MRAHADHRGLALVFESPEDVDEAIANLEHIKKFKQEQNRPWPGVYVITDPRMPDNEAKEFHDQVWFMHYTTAQTPMQKSDSVNLENN